MTEFNEQKIASVAAQIIDAVKLIDADIGVKVAALRSAADIMQNAISIRSLAQMLANIMDPNK